ncbi:MAG: hypothetical protein GQF41_3927 [Candidatus Rifleibacterium amylolyticum]|nr:MAG: hypothetical protein GQF41_3927 [Candidatus Rifleibacterium amylolyticum]
MTALQGKYLTLLLDYLKKSYFPFYRAVEAVKLEHENIFTNLGDFACNAAVNAFGEDVIEKMARAYAYFVTDANKEQLKYCIRGHYRNKTYKEVFDSVYDNDDYMQNYHWGVFATTFLWKHHLEIFKFFTDRFLNQYIQNRSRVIDFGSGSGIWSLIAANQNHDLSITGIDISKSSLQIAKMLSQGAGLEKRINFQVQDALSFCSDQKFQAGISCFLLEHLESPADLLKNLSMNLAPDSPCFVTGAITAAEVDHIYEFKKESELISLAESCGFRIVETFTGCPAPLNRSIKFLPRSLALIMRKKQTELW